MSDAEDRIHPPSPQKYQEARAAGLVAKSHDLTLAVVAIVGPIVVLLSGPQLAAALGELARTMWQTAWIDVDRSQLAAESAARVTGVLSLTVLPIVTIALAAAVAELLQVGWLWRPERLLPDASRLHPLQGLSKLASGASAARLLGGGAKLIVIMGVAASCIYGQWSIFLGLTTAAPTAIAAFLIDFLPWTMLKIGAALLAWGAVDYASQRRRFDRSLWMTAQEVADEAKGRAARPRVGAISSHSGRSRAALPQPQSSPDGRGDVPTGHTTSPAAR